MLKFDARLVSVLFQRHVLGGNCVRRSCDSSTRGLRSRHHCLRNVSFARKRLFAQPVEASKPKLTLEREWVLTIDDYFRSSVEDVHANSAV